MLCDSLSLLPTLLVSLWTETMEYCWLLLILDKILLLPMSFTIPSSILLTLTCLWLIRDCNYPRSTTWRWKSKRLILTWILIHSYKSTPRLWDLGHQSDSKDNQDKKSLPEREGWKGRVLGKISIVVWWYEKVGSESDEDWHLDFRRVGAKE